MLHIYHYGKFQLQKKGNVLYLPLCLNHTHSSQKTTYICLGMFQCFCSCVVQGSPSLRPGRSWSP